MSKLKKKKKKKSKKYLRKLIFEARMKFAGGFSVLAPGGFSVFPRGFQRSLTYRLFVPGEFSVFFPGVFSVLPA